MIAPSTAPPALAGLSDQLGPKPVEEFIDSVSEWSRRQKPTDSIADAITNRPASSVRLGMVNTASPQHSSPVSVVHLAAHVLCTIAMVLRKSNDRVIL